MLKHLWCMGTVLVVIGSTAVAQTTVTTPGGTGNAVPKFSDNGTIVNSAIVESNGNVGIGISNPAVPFDVRKLSATTLINLGLGRFLPYVSIDFQVDGNPGPNGSNGIWISSGTSFDNANAFGINVYPDNSTMFPGLTRFSGGARSKGFIFSPDTANAYMDFRVGPPNSTISAIKIAGNGNVGINNASPAAALDVNGNIKMSGNSNTSLIFPDGSVQTHAWTGTTSENGVTSINNNDGSTGFQFLTSSQTLGATFGAGGNLAIQANSVFDTTATGGYLFLGGSDRGDAIRSKIWMTGNSVPGVNPSTSGIQINGANNVGIGLNPQYDPGARLEVNGGVKLSSGSGGTITFPDGSVQSTAYTGGSVSPSSPDITDTNGNVGIGTTNPGSKLEVNGGLKLTAGSGGSITFADGSVQSTAATGSSGSSGGGYSAITQVGTNIGINTTTPRGPLDVHGQSFGFVVSGQNIDPADNYPLTFLQNSGSLLEGWNRSAGGGETDFIANRGAGGAGGFNFYDYANDGSLNFLTTFQGNGNVGIGTGAPVAKLEVNGNMKLTSGSGASLTFADNTVQSTAWTGTTCGGDYAESVDVKGDRTNYAPGDVLVIDPESDGKFLKSAEPYSTSVAGIYSTKPGLVGRRQTTDAKTSTTEIPMAMVGIVPTKVSAENGPIKRGDLLVTSSTLGYVMKGTDRSLLVGAVVGKALGALESGTGVIEVLVSLQ